MGKDARIFTYPKRVVQYLQQQAWLSLCKQNGGGGNRHCIRHYAGGEGCAFVALAGDRSAEEYRMATSQPWVDAKSLPWKVHCSDRSL